MSAKKWNFYYDEKDNQFTTSHVVSIVSLWISIGLLWASFLMIFMEHFPDFISCETYVYDTQSFRDPSLVKKIVGLDWFMLIVFLIMTWFPYSGLVLENRKKKALWKKLMPLVVPVLYTIMKWNKITLGLSYIMQQYLVRFNAYNGTNLIVQPGIKDYAPVAFTLVLMLLWLAVWGISKLIKKNVLLVLFPVTALFMELIVGRSPEGNGIFLMFVAALLLMVPEKTKIWKHAVVIVIAVLSIFITGIAFKDDITKLSSDKNIIDEWISKIELPTWEVDKWFTVDFQIDSESLTNNQPHYNGGIVLKIETGGIPDSKLYLRGFYGTEYKNGKWTCGRYVFENACKEAGYSQEQVAEALSQRPYQTVVEAGLGRRLAYKINYIGTVGNIAFLPYYMDSSSLNGEYDFVGDYLIRKDIRDTQISVLGTYLGDVTDAGLYITDTMWIEGYEIMQWYNDVALSYAKSSTSLKCIKDAAEYIKSKAVYPTKEILKENFPNVQYGETTRQMVFDNLYRMELAELVRNYLANQMSYSVLLDDLPKGTDPVEYALTVSHEGYCMHYATAATLILKELGVPARYASGYVVRPVDFEYDVSSHMYNGNVPDNNAHAWVEIYMDNMGWIPVEVTEGYSSDTDMIPTKVSPDRWELIAEENRQMYEDGRLPLQSEDETDETESELPTETESETESESATEEIETESSQDSEIESEETESETESDETETESHIGGGSDKKDDSDKRIIPKEYIIVFGAILGFLIIVGLVYSLRTKDALFAKRLQKIMDNEQTRRAVNMMNRRVYGKIRWKRSGHLSDKAYLKALIEICDVVEPKDWERYMEIVKRAHYSHEDISVEEMMHCYWCYKSV